MTHTFQIKRNLTADVVVSGGGTAATTSIGSATFFMPKALSYSMIPQVLVSL